VYVEVWTEKDALAGVLLEETAAWDVPLMVSRGFSSISYLYEAAREIERQGRAAAQVAGDPGLVEGNLLTLGVAPV
jgi:hypothetical protein